MEQTQLKTRQTPTITTSLMMLFGRRLVPVHGKGFKHRTEVPDVLLFSSFSRNFLPLGDTDQSEIKHLHMADTLKFVAFSHCDLTLNGCR